jgi:hypothetical protein
MSLAEACWDGYEAYGFKIKDGRKVPNCIPKIDSPNRKMPYHLELGSDGHSFKGKAIVVNSQSGKHYSKEPIPLVNAKKQMRALYAAEKKK